MPENVANRYCKVRLIGTGGMATVHEVVDMTTGVSRALKQLTPKAAEKPSAAVLFRREFATLAQLAHPLIIRVDDYGVDGGLPYYTMELIEGESLRGVGRVPWKEACALLRDVASALAIVHMRRLVHRDVSATNVYRTREGRAKLLDFGALAAMGLALDLVGTPPFVPPEALDGQPLDGRSDLFSLGALAYFLLTGSHAYSAHRLSDLRSAWVRLVDPPGMRVPGIPEALDTLVMSLLSLNPLARPRSAGEVFERLTSIAELSVTEGQETAQAYLVTPVLVARGSAMQRFRRRLTRAQERRGAALLIEGQAGFGRTRLLRAFLTEAKLNGVLALYADGKTASMPFDVARALGRRLIESDPSAAHNGKAPLILEQLSILPSVEQAAPIESEAWPELIDALVAWFLEVATRVALTIGIDDLDRCDSPSIAVLSKLAELSPSRQLLVVATAELGARGAIEGFRGVGSALLLHPLRAPDTRALLSSVFGDVSHLDATAQWIHRVSGGNPRTALRLAQHVVDIGVVKYENAAWVLPRSLDALTLPTSMDQALDARVASLSPSARELAEMLALTVGHEAELIPEVTALWEEQRTDDAFLALNELVAAEVLESSGTSYTFVNKDIKQAVQRAIPHERRPELHRRLARAYDGLTAGADVYAAYHLTCAHEEAQAFGLFVRILSERKGGWRRGLDFVSTPYGAMLYERMFEWGLVHGCGPEEVALVGRALLQLAAVSHLSLAKHAPVILERLRADAGLVHWDAFQNVADPLERVRCCIGRAYAEREEKAESERGLAPEKAIQEFAICTGMLAGVCARTRDANGATRLVRDIDPLRPLSPAIDVVANVAAYTADAICGRAANPRRQLVLEQVAQPVPGLEELARHGIRQVTLFYMALEEASSGDPAVEERIRALEDDPSFAPLAWQARTVVNLYAGAEKLADTCRRKRDLALVGRTDVNRHIDVSVSYEAFAYLLLEDLMGMKRVLPVLRSSAEQWPGWKAPCLIIESAYSGLRGDLAGALDSARGAYRVTAPDSNLAWSLSAVRLTHALLEMQRPSEAYELASSALAACEGIPILPHLRDQLEMCLALAESRVGKSKEALARADFVAERAEQRLLRGVHLLDLWTMQARIARDAGAAKAFNAACKRLIAACAHVDSVAFATKLANLLQVSVPKGFESVAASVTSLSAYGAGAATLAAKMRSELDVCRGAQERAKRTLELLLEHSGTDQGYLYLNHPEGLALAATRAQAPPPVALEDRLAEWVETVDDDFDTGSLQSATGTGDATSEGSPFAFLKVTADAGGQTVLTAVAVLDCRRRYPTPIAPAAIAAIGQSLLDSGDAVVY